MSDVIEKYRDFGSSISDFLLSIGLEPIYVVTAFFLILVISHWKYYKRWDELSQNQQNWLRLWVIATVMCLVASVIYFFGGFPEDVS